MVAWVESISIKTGWCSRVAHKEENIRQHHKSSNQQSNSRSPGTMSLAVGLSAALEVIGVKEYIGHVISGFTGWLLDKAYGWWSGTGQSEVPALEVDVERGESASQDEIVPDGTGMNLESTSLCIVSEFGVLESSERSASCCGWRFAVSREFVHEN